MTVVTVCTRQNSLIIDSAPIQIEYHANTLPGFNEPILFLGESFYDAYTAPQSLVSLRRVVYRDRHILYPTPVKIKVNFKTDNLNGNLLL